MSFILDSPVSPKLSAEGERMKAEVYARHAARASVTSLSGRLKIQHQQQPTRDNGKHPEDYETADTAAVASKLLLSCDKHRKEGAVQVEAMKSLATGSVLSQSNVQLINGHRYTVLKEIGRGGSSKVFSVYNEEMDLFAIKCVDLRNADETISRVYLNEVTLLARLQHSRRVIKLFEHEYNRRDGMLYVVMERGDVDLATVIDQEMKEGGGGGGLTPEIVVCYWAEMLRAVRDIHKAGVIHSDLKPANFLLVAGKLKLIDFGIASVIPKDVTSIIKDVKCGTPSYMSPEALMDDQHLCDDGGAENNESGVHVKIGVKSDVWSLGCILYHMVYGQTPFQHLRGNLRLLAIVDPSYKIAFPTVNNAHLLEVLKKCIVRDVKQRASVDELLNHPFIPRNYRAIDWANKLALANGGKT